MTAERSEMMRTQVRKLPKYSRMAPEGTQMSPNQRDGVSGQDRKVSNKDGRVSDQVRSASNQGGVISEQKQLANLTLTEQVDRDDLILALLKVAIIDYRMEARFRQPILAAPRPTDSRTNGSSSSSRRQNDTSGKSQHRFSKLIHNSDHKLSSETISKLKEKLNSIAMNQGTAVKDDLTRRSLLRFYNELLKNEIPKDQLRFVEPMVVRFASCASKEISLKASIPQDQTSNLVFKQVEFFISILIKIVKLDKHGDSMIKKLEELRDTMRPSGYTLFLEQQLQQQLQKSQDLKYLEPSFDVSDMTLALYIGKVFKVGNLLKKISELKADTTNTALVTEYKQILSQYEGQSKEVRYQLEDFSKITNYLNWKTAEERSLKSSILRFKPLKDELNPRSEFQIIPQRAVREFFIETVKGCLQNDLQLDSMLSNSSQELLTICCKLWRIDQFSKMAWIYTAINESLEKGPLNEDVVHNFFQFCNSLSMDQQLWPIPIQKEWLENLSCTYIQIMREIREDLTLIFNEVKPKFGSLLKLLSLVETDQCFELVRQTKLPSKWEKKLTNALLKISESRYVELLKQVPLDASLNFGHVSLIAESITDDAQLLTKRYPNPLLGYLYIPHTYAQLTTALFALDSKNMLLHIVSNSQGQVHYGDSMEIYRKLCEIRSIFKQVQPGKEFKFDLEAFFTPYVEEWCEESGTNIVQYIERALQSDEFNPVNIESEALYSSSIVDIFAMINQSIGVLIGLNWINLYQSLKFVSKLLRYISSGIIDYANKIMEMMLSELDDHLEEDVDDDQKLFNQTTEWLKSAVPGSKMRSAPPPQPFDFHAATCVRLNNLEALLSNLQKLEKTVDPEELSLEIQSNESQIKLLSHLFSIRILRAEDLKKLNNSRLPDTYLSLLDGVTKRRVLKTRTIKKHLNPEWDEEFEFEVPPGSSAILGATIWDCSSRLGQQNVCGRTVINLQPKRFNMDGLPQTLELDLDTQGKLVLQVSMESEREDPVFSIGRAYRSIARNQERSIKLIVEKFSTFIVFAISRDTLRLVSETKYKPGVSKSVLEPLFDYLNSNFQVLATYLSEALLLKVILQTWVVVLNTVDDLLLPKLSALKSFALFKTHNRTSKRSSTASWLAVTHAISNVTGGNQIVGFGKPLSLQDVDVLFEWLKILCYEFFHNNGAGPPLEELKNEHFQELLLVPVYYDHPPNQLKEEVERFSPATLKMIRERHFSSFGTRKLTRLGTKARKNTVMASGSAKQREKAHQDYIEARSDPILSQLALENIILRLLLLKGEHDYVLQRLEQRERLSKSISAEFFARLAAEGG